MNKSQQQLMFLIQKVIQMFLRLFFTLVDRMDIIY